MLLTAWRLQAQSRLPEWRYKALTIRKSEIEKMFFRPSGCCSLCNWGWKIFASVVGNRDVVVETHVQLTLGWVVIGFIGLWLGIMIDRSQWGVFLIEWPSWRYWLRLHESRDDLKETSRQDTDIRTNSGISNFRLKSLQVQFPYSLSI